MVAIPISSPIDVALFPIPGSVAFPGVPVTLHVFEPRYRQMVKQCVDESLLMGVCDTERVVHAKDGQQSVEEALSTNQSTYKPRAIFSAGPVNVLEELSDGRLLISVETQTRMVLSSEKQTLPFNIWQCKPLQDESVDQSTKLSLAQCKEKILQRLIVLTDGQPKVQDDLRSDYWQSMDEEAFSFEMSGRIKMDPELAQHLLETTDTQMRLDTLLQLINGGN